MASWSSRSSPMATGVEDDANDLIVKGSAGDEIINAVLV
jgi:hypothetical protein